MGEFFVLAWFPYLIETCREVRKVFWHGLRGLHGFLVVSMVFKLKAYQTNIPPSKSFFRYSKPLIAICLFFYFFYQPNIGKRF